MNSAVDILYVEDDKGLAILLSRKMERLGHKVTHVLDVASALVAITEHDFDIIVADYNLGGATGLDLISALKDRKDAPPSIMLTGSGSEVKAVEALKAGAKDYLVKDVEGNYFSLLPSVIEKAINSHQQLREKQEVDRNLRRSNALLNAEQNAVESALLAIDNDGRVMSYNSMLLAMFDLPDDFVRDGCDKDLLAALRSMVKFYDEYIDVVKQIYKDPACSRQNDIVELKDGRILSRNTSPIRDDTGEIIGRVWDYRDITEQERKNRRLALTQFGLDSLSIPVFWVDENGRFSYVNKSAATRLGYGRDELCAMNVIDISPNMTPEKWSRHWAKLKENRSMRFEATHRTKSGEIFPVEVTANFIEYGRFAYNIAYANDISERKRSEEKILLAAKVFETADEGVAVTDLDGLVLSINPAFTVITGYGEDEIIGYNVKKLKSNRHDALFHERLWNTLIRDGAWKGEIWNRRKNGEAYPQSTSISAIKNAKGEVTQYAMVFNDITTSKENEEEIKYKAYHDPLTGLSNRQLFFDRLERAKKRSLRSGKKVALLYIDLDGFKPVNDSLGHAVGDLTLRGVAIRLVECARELDTISRLGGDEFSIIMEELDDERSAVMVAERINRSLAEPFNYNGKNMTISASIGVAIFPDDGASIEVLARNADAAMYHAKKEGKNRFAFYRSSMTESALQRQTMERSLSADIENGKIEVYYQPKVDLATRKLAGFEALARWRREDGGFVPPDQFIPMAEECGLITSLDLHILGSVCRFLSEMKRSGAEVVPVSVNLSACDIALPDIVATVEGVVKSAGISPDLIEIEVTETSLIGNVKSAADCLRLFRAKGFKVAIDDFGTAYSSLSYLVKFPVSTLKIDKSFIMDMSSNPSAVAVAKAVVVMGHEIGATVIAEGLENIKHVEQVAQFGCDHGQGYYFGRPVPAEETASIIKRQKSFF